MAITLFHHNKKKKPTTVATLRKKQLRPRQWWKWFCFGFLGALVILAAYFGLLFIKTEHALDAPPTITPDTNAATIATIQQMLSDTKAAIEARTGIPVGQ